MPGHLVTHRDQMGWLVTIPDKIERIVSLVPSQTEYLCSLGLEKKIVGITRFCIHPDSCFRSKVRVGGTKDFDLEAIRLLQPDLIIANKEENEEEQVLKLKTMYPVWISDVKNLEEAKQMMLQLGEVLGKKEKAIELVRKTEHNFAHLVPLQKKIKALYLIWRKPYMTVNKNTFIHSMMEVCGFQNIYAGNRSRYPKISENDLPEKQPEVILLSSEPYPFREKHFEEIHRLYPDARIYLVDGEYFSWYGSRLIQAPAYLSKLVKKCQ